MKTYHVDIETRSKLNIKETGVTRYAKDESTTILCICYAEETGPVATWLPGMPVPNELRVSFHMIAHNAAFERAIWENVAVKLGFARAASYECTMIAAYQRNLPGALANTAPALKLPERKDKEGKTVMLRMTKHDYEEKLEASWLKKTKRKTSPISVKEAMEGFADQVREDTATLLRYCQQDVVTERAIHRKIQMREFDLYELDAKINARGVWVDVQTAQAISKCIDLELTDLDGQLFELTGGEINSARQTGKLTLWLKERGYSEENLTAQAVQNALDKRDELDPAAVAALELRQKVSLGSVGKYAAMLKGQLNGRLHDLIQFRGASQTGRYAGRRVQVQNLPRLELSDAEVELLIYLFRKQDRDRIRFLFGDVFFAAKQMLRPMLGSPNGLIVSDFAQVEARVVAWVAGQLDTLESFIDESRDPYKEMASSIYDVSVDEVTDHQRFIGKMCVLGAGFGLGGFGFYNQLSRRGIEITEEEGQAAIDAYRAKNPKIVNFWYRVEDAMRYVIAHPGESQAVNELIEFESANQDELGICVKLRLPSSRCLFYMGCWFVDDPDSDHKPRITFRGSDWDDETTYGGKIVENLTQAIANDLLNHALLELDKSGYEIVMHVHDETVTQNVSELDVGKINTIMENAPKWAVGFPLKAETKFCKTNRYTK